MAFEESSGNGMYMPVAPAYGGNGGGFGNGDGWWIILLLLACGGGWGGFGGGWGGGFGNMQLGYDFPWILNGQNNLSGQMSDGFRDQMLNTTLNTIQNGVTSGFGDVQTALCGGFAGVNATINGAQNALSQQMYTSDLAALNRSFAEQTANTQGFFGVQSGIADLRYTEATEGCATRTAAANNTRDIIDSQNRGTQAILDKLCQLELDGVKGQLAQAQRDNVGLQNQLNMATMQASQVSQTAQIVDQTYNRLRNCPVNAVPVFGNQPIFTCPTNVGSACGCGNATGFVA